MGLIRRFFALSAALSAVFLATPALAGCPGLVVDNAPVLRRVAFERSTVPTDHVSLTFIGHASYLIETPGGIAAVTDYNGVNIPAFTPDLITMNNAHSTHYVSNPPPAIGKVLRGWSENGTLPFHDVKLGDLRVRNLSTNTRDSLYGGSGTRRYGNSIFIFEVEGICIAHTSHLHHPLTPEDLDDLGKIDVLILPVDGSWTLPLEDALDLVDKIRPSLLVPTHYIGPWALERFMTAVGERYPKKRNPSAKITLTKSALPTATEIMVLQGF
jgi:L-ascorbate metabolism protein UlaG (beta-lactamase superfamily)